MSTADTAAAWSLPKTVAPVPPPPDRPESAALVAQLERVLVDLRRMYRERNEALQEVSRAHHEALLRLAMAAEMRDGDTGVHIVRIGFLAEALARAAGESTEFSQRLRQAAPMHDVGKIGIPDAVLKKPGALTPDERAVMCTHPAIGAAILGRSRIDLFTLASEVAMTHHERWDGKGYPNALAGENIPRSGRIVAIVDFFDALTMDRCYRPAFSDQEALRMLIEQRGAAFEPLLVDTFLEHQGEMIALRERVNRSQAGFSALIEGLQP